jgi:polyisoprenoid-binding protein YceI
MKSIYTKPLLLGASLVALTACAEPASAAEWAAVPETSTITFTGTQQGSAFSGKFEEFTATIDFDPANPTAGKIVGVVKTESVTTRDSSRDTSLLERDWFSVDKYPEARFESKTIEKTADGFRANGELTLKGKTNPVVMDFTFTAGQNSSAPGTAQFVGKMKIDRFDFNVGEGWNDPSYVGQDVPVEIKLDLKK